VIVVLVEIDLSEKIDDLELLAAVHVFDQSGFHRSAFAAMLPDLDRHLEQPAQSAADGDEARVVSTGNSRVTVMVIPTNEEWEIARQSRSVVQQK
jgi:acetate kinase